jgi:REP-associated tyrosine transposase
MRPAREHATNTGHTYMITSGTWSRRSLFQRECWAKLLIDTLYHYRGTAYFLHEFVVMPDHIHILLTPKTSLERAVQFIKGGFSYQAKKEFGSNMEIWQKGFSDHRVRDVADYRQHIFYIRQNPVRKHLSERAEGYPYSSASAGIELDPIPQGLKPEYLVEPIAARLEAAPFQNNDSRGAAKSTPIQNDASHGVTDAAFSKKPSGAAETDTSRNKSGKMAS